jgi:hypothetical protein
MLLVLDVAQFEQHRPQTSSNEHLKWRLLEFHCFSRAKRRPYDHARVVDGGFGMLPIASGPRQAQALLELLAKLLMEMAEDLTALLIRGMNWPWGVGCLHLAYCHDETTVTISNLFQRRHFPAMFVVGQVPAESDALSAKVRGKRCRLEDLCLQTKE